MLLRPPPPWRRQSRHRRPRRGRRRQREEAGMAGAVRCGESATTVASHTHLSLRRGRVGAGPARDPPPQFHFWLSWSRRSSQCIDRSCIRNLMAHGWRRPAASSSSQWCGPGDSQLICTATLVGSPTPRSRTQDTSPHRASLPTTPPPPPPPHLPVCLFLQPPPQSFPLYRQSRAQGG